MGLIINGEKVEESQIQQEIERIRQRYEAAFKDKEPEQRQRQLYEWSRENVIERVLINQQAKKFGEDVSAKQVQTAFENFGKQYNRQNQNSGTLNEKEQEKLKKGLENQIRVENFLNELCKDVPDTSQEEIKQYYKDNLNKFTTPERVRVSHIVKHINWQSDEQTAYNIIRQAQKELEKGAAFESVVGKYSDCPDNGGDMGYIVAGQMVQEFEHPVFNLGVNQVSGIFQTRFGFHIAKVYDRQGPVTEELDKVKNDIAEQLKDKERRKVVEEYLDKIKAKAKIRDL